METRKDRLELVDRLEKNAAKRTAVSGTLLLTSELSGKSVTVPAVLLAQWPDKFRLEVQDPVGGLIALVVVNGGSYWLYEREKAEILTGSVKNIPFPLIPKASSEDLVRYFLARPYMDRVRRGELGDSRSVLREQAVRETVEWDNGPEPILWQRLSGDRILHKVEYENYEAKEGLRFPAKMRLTGASGDGRLRQVLLIWKDWQVSVPSIPKMQMLFQIPQKQTFGRKIKVLP